MRRAIAVLVLIVSIPAASAAAAPCPALICEPLAGRVRALTLPDASALGRARSLAAALGAAAPGIGAPFARDARIDGLPGTVSESAAWLLGGAGAADRIRAAAVPAGARWRSAAFRALAQVRRDPRGRAQADPALLAVAERVDIRRLGTALATLAAAADRALATVHPVDGPCDGDPVAPTEYADGRIAVDEAGTRTRYAKPYVLSIDLGGCDEYLSTTAGADGGVSIALDLGGQDDLYVQPKDTYGLGAANEGVGLLVDDGGDDVYRAQSYASMGAGIVGGVGMLADLGGDDRYEYVGAGGGFGAHGNGTIGAGALLDLGGDDVYRYVFDPGDTSFGSRLLGAQGAGTVASIGVLADAAGNDVYEAITYGNTVSIEAQGAADFLPSLGVLLDAGSGSDMYRVEAHVSKAGGFASGNASGQGYGILDGTGILLDQGGEDTYEVIGSATGSTGASIGANGQGFGTAVIQFEGNGALVDLAGNDTRTVSAAATADDPTRTFASSSAQGAGYFLGQGVLADLGGTDTYSQTVEAANRVAIGQGAGVGAATGVLVDRSGPDRYSAPPGRTQGYGGAFSFSDITVPGGVGVVVDGGGRNLFSGPGREASIWFQGQDGAGVGLDGGRVISTGVDTVDGILYLFGLPRPGAVVSADIQSPAAGAVLHGDVIVRGGADGGSLDVEYVEWRTDFDPWALGDPGGTWQTWSGPLDVDRLLDGYHEVIARAWAQGVPSANAVAPVTVERWLPAWDVGTEGNGLRLAFDLRNRKGERIEDGEVSLRVLDSTGATVALFGVELFAGEGRYETTWTPQGPGVYTLRAEIPGQLLGETTVQA